MNQQQIDQLSTKVSQYEAAIRKHRDQRGDDRCWLDDRTLYSVLPEGYTPPKEDTAVLLSNCRKFLDCRRDPQTTYVSPQREIERLEELKTKLVAGLLAGSKALASGVATMRHVHPTLSQHLDLAHRSAIDVLAIAMAEDREHPPKV